MKLRYFVYFIVIVLLLTIQATWVAQVFQWGSQPSLYLVFLLWIGYQEGKQPAQILGFLSGIVIDLLIGIPLGVSSFVLALFGYFAGIAKGRFFYDSIFYPIVISALAVLYKQMMYMLVFGMFQIKMSASTFFSGHWVLELSLTSILSPIVFSLASLVKSRFVRSYGGFTGG